jgi:hypothetical protein
MIISNDFVFIHVPKTGGSSFERMLEERHDMHVTGDQHDIAADIPDEHRGKFVFGFLRDPMSAEISNWRYHLFSWKRKGMTFEGWCEWRYGGNPAEYGYELGLKDHEVEYGHIFNVRPAAGYFCDAEGQCIADRICRYENLESETKWLSEEFGLDLGISDYNVMATATHDVPQPEVSDRCRELVYNAKAIDFDVHGASGDISVNYTCPVVPNYGYVR